MSVTNEHVDIDDTTDDFEKSTSEETATLVAPENAARKRGLFTKLRLAFRRFRRTRPFWGSIVLGLGGWFVLKPVITPKLDVLTALGVGGATVYILGGAMIAAALIAFVLPAQRHFPAIMAAIASVASLPLANLGGWLIGMLLGIIGSGLVFAWAPYSDKHLAKFAERDRVKATKKTAKHAAKRSGTQTA